MPHTGSPKNRLAKYGPPPKHRRVPRGRQKSELSYSKLSTVYLQDQLNPPAESVAGPQHQFCGALFGLFQKESTARAPRF